MHDHRGYAGEVPVGSPASSLSDDRRSWVPLCSVFSSATSRHRQSPPRRPVRGPALEEHPRWSDFRRVSPQGTHLAYPGSDELAPRSIAIARSLEAIRWSMSADPLHLVFSPAVSELRVLHRTPAPDGVRVERRNRFSTSATATAGGGGPSTRAFGLSWGDDGSLDGWTGWRCECRRRTPRSLRRRRMATWVTAHSIVPNGDHALVSEVPVPELGGTPSRSTLDRLPKELSERSQRQQCRIRARLRLRGSRAEAVIVAVSLDGVMVPMKAGQRKEKRAAAAAAGKPTRGPVFARRPAPVTGRDHERAPISHTVRMGRMPESKKATIKGMAM